jgi:hypothetical protein
MELAAGLDIGFLNARLLLSRQLDAQEVLRFGHRYDCMHRPWNAFLAGPVISLF